jgi:hypothetical protein
LRSFAAIYFSTFQAKSCVFIRKSNLQGALDGAQGINQSPFMYRIIGVDGREYGPISADQLRQWIAQSRANASTPALTEGATEWKPLASIPEFSMLFATPATYAAVAVSGLRTNGCALTGFILGMVSGPFCLFCCCFGPLCSILAIVFSLIGLSQINRRPDVYGGKSFAVAGLVIAILALVFYVILIMTFGIAASLSPDGATHHGYKL